MTDEESGPVADLSQIVLPVEDPEASIRFYTEHFRLRPTGTPDSSPIRWLEWANGILLGFEARDEGPPLRPLRLVARVEDPDSIRQGLEAAGIECLPTSGGFLAQDPDGHRLILLAGRGVTSRMVSRSRIADNRLLLEEEILLPGAPSDVWSALTDPALLSAWLCGGPARIDPRADGELSLTFPHIGRSHTTWTCRLVDFIPPARLRFREEDLGLEVSFDLAPNGPEQTRLRLSQTPFTLDGLDEPAGAFAQRLALSWRRILRRLELLLVDELVKPEPRSRQGEE